LRSSSHRIGIAGRSDKIGSSQLVLPCLSSEGRNRPRGRTTSLRKQNTSEAARKRLQGIGMSEPATAEFIEKGIEAARIGNRLLARLHFERAAKESVVDPIVWLWLAWVADSPLQAATHLKKLQTTPLAAAAASGLQWIKALTYGHERPKLQRADETATEMQQPAVSVDGAANDPNGPVYALGCPGCRARLRIWGKLIGPLHHCPACGTVFVAEQDPNDPTRLVRRRLSSDASRSESSESSATLDAGQPLILILDDRATRRQLMANVLRRSGFRVQSATNGVDALALAIQHKPNVILVDGNLQNQDAYAVCKEFRSCPETASMPIVMLSSKSGFFDQVQAKLAGCAVYVTKPCEAEVLLTHVQNLTRESELALEPVPTVPEIGETAEVSVNSVPCTVPHQSPTYLVRGVVELKETSSFNALDVAVRQFPVSAGKDPAELHSSIFG
jgi:DNA-binding response OmpR family regulator